MATFYVGQIIQGGWNFAPSGSSLCNGQLLAISQNQALFALIGTFYGGNGTTNFGLPELRGRSMVHQGQGPGLPTYSMGEIGGTTTAGLTIQNLPSHTHTFSGAGSALKAAGLQPHASSVVAATGSVLGHAVDISGNANLAQPAIYCPSGTTADVTLAGLNVAGTNSLTGGSLPFSILNPFNTVTMAIVLLGVFPSRN